MKVQLRQHIKFNGFINLKMAYLVAHGPLAAVMLSAP